MDRERRGRRSRGPEPPAGRPHPSLSSVLARAVGTEAQGHRTPGSVPGAQTTKGSSWLGFEGLLGGCRSGRADIIKEVRVPGPHASSATGFRARELLTASPAPTDEGCGVGRPP